jgi:hypothetical protein
MTTDLAALKELVSDLDGNNALAATRARAELVVAIGPFALARDLLRMAEAGKQAHEIAAAKIAETEDAYRRALSRAEAAEAKLAEIHAYAKIPRDNGGHPKNYELFRERIATLSAQEMKP